MVVSSLPAVLVGPDPPEWMEDLFLGTCSLIGVGRQGGGEHQDEQLEAKESKT